MRLVDGDAQFFDRVVHLFGAVLQLDGGRLVVHGGQGRLGGAGETVGGLQELLRVVDEVELGHGRARVLHAELNALNKLRDQLGNSLKRNLDFYFRSILAIKFLSFV